MRIHCAGLAAVSLFAAVAFADAIPDRNVNMVAGTSWPGGDPYLQRQNEPSIAVSTRNPLHLLAGSNDYRTVDIPGLEGIKVIGDAWLGVYRSYDGGSTWTSTLLPGYPQDTSLAGMSSPLKGYPAGADPVVRAGANGLFYYAGIVLSRDENPLGGVFVARYLDYNDKESSHLVTEEAHSIRYVDTRFLQKGTSGQFNDKPWLAVDTPRSGSIPCIVDGNQIAGGNAYVAWTTFVGGDQNVRSKMMIARSTDCGATWDAPIKLSESHAINQGASIAIDPTSGHVYVAWRRITNGKESNALLLAKSTDFGRTFSQAQVVREITPFEQGTTPLSFRTTMFPSITVDDTGRIYMAWSERTAAGWGRIALISSSNGTDWSAPQFVANHGLGHQFMPTISFAHGKLTLAWYDQAEDHTTGIYTPIETPDGKLSGQYSEARKNTGHRELGLLDHVFNSFIQEIGLGGTRLLRRHTVDVFTAQADPGVMPLFASRRASQYYFGSRPEPQEDGSFPIEQMQYNPANLPLFQQGTVPFLGDYIDIATASPTVRHLVWTDNRDVRPPLDGNWRNYTPPASSGGPSRFDSTIPTPQCVPGQAGMRNQNIYTARITNGLFAGSPGNTKPFFDENGAPLQRAFVVFVQNALRETKTYRLTIASQPTGGTASFLQFDLLESLDVAIPARSSIARTVFATSAVKYDEIEVLVEEITSSGQPVPDGLSTTVVLNPDIANPDIANPDIANPDIANPDIANAEVYNPDIANPDIANPDIANPDIANPDIANPDIANPDIANPDIANPDIANPDIANPDIANPDIANPDIANGSVTDTTWETTNEGNTVASYSVNLLLTGQVPDAFKLQLIVHRIYETPIAKADCTLGVERHTVLAANINNPEFTDPDEIAANDVNDPSEKNATVYILPGETIRVTLRVIDPNRFDDVTFNAAEQVTPVVVAHAVNTLDLATGQPPVSLAIITTALPAASSGVPYAAQLAAIGGSGAKTWSLAGGSLPAGLQLTPGGAITGTPVAAGTSTFSARVTDAALHTAEQKFSIQVTASSLFVQFMTQPVSGVEGTSQPNIIVRAQDQNGAPVPGVTITLELRNASALCAGTMSPRSSTTSAAGLASFNELPPIDACYGYVYRATASVVGFTGNSADSNPFDVYGFGDASQSLFPSIEHSATLLQDGTILLQGGFSNGQNLCAGELYDVATYQSVEAGNGRCHGAHTTALLQDGRAVIAGGYSIADKVVQIVDTHTIYDPAAKEYTTSTDLLPVPVADHTSTPLPDGTVVLIGGRNDSAPVAAIQTFNGTAFTSGPELRLITARYDHTATLAGDYVVITGGRDSSSPLTSVELYNWRLRTIVRAGDLLTPRSLHTATLLPDGRILIAGGMNDSGIASSAEIYDPVSGTSAEASNNMSVARANHVAEMLPDGTIVFAGGFGDQPPTGGPLVMNDAVDLYDPATGQFEPFGALSSPRAAMRAVVVDSAATPAKLFVLRGEEMIDGVRTHVATVEAFYPRKSTFTVNGELLYAGGSYSPTATPDFYISNRRTNTREHVPVDYDGGKFTIRDLPPGSYTLIVSIDANPGNFLYSPGDLLSSADFDAAEAATSGLRLDVQQVIHMTAPHDNANLFDVSPLDCPPPTEVPLGPVEIAWDEVEFAATYQWRIWLATCDNFSGRTVVASGTTNTTSATAALGFAGSNGFYILEIFAYTEVGIPVGILMTVGPTFHQWDHRFVTPNF